MDETTDAAKVSFALASARAAVRVRTRPILMTAIGTAVGMLRIADSLHCTRGKTWT